MFEGVLIVDGGFYLQLAWNEPSHPTSRPEFLFELVSVIRKLHQVEITEIHYFDAVINERYHSFKGMSRMDKRRRQFLRSLQQLSESEPDCPKIELHIQHLKPLNIHCPNTECPHNTEPIIKPIQAGVDVDIASFALAELKDSFKFVFFWMGDGDLAPTIQALRSRAYNKQVQLVLANQKSLSVGLRAVLQINNITFIDDVCIERPEIIPFRWQNSTTEDVTLCKLKRVIPRDSPLTLNDLKTLLYTLNFSETNIHKAIQRLEERSSFDTIFSILNGNEEVA
eukprot:gene248-3624_t